ncbi:MAG: ABC transporter substrate-binding protein [Spirochaetaceae bacterium]|nr:ABC transporter substrate-binding protein [Spirochaetaceae bacterium]
MKRVLLMAAVVPLMVASAWADYKEAPMLAALVAAGELPPVEERLPLEPKVRAVFDEIGTYGGQVIVFGNSPNPWAPLVGENPEGTPTPIRMDLDGSFEPDLALDYHLSDDYMTFTLTLREGSKWSNGDPFTAEDFSFHFNDMQKAELGYVWAYPSQVKTVTAVDDLTVVIEYSEPYPKVAQDLVTYKGTDWTLYQPSTWLKQWHAEYNENANAMAKEEGFDNWQDAFSDHSTFCCPQRNIERPTMAPFMLADVQPTFRLKERNPYYFAVDSAGQQLPYIDSGLIQIIADGEARRLKVIGGEADFATIPLDAYPLLVQGQQSGNYNLNLLEAWFEGTGLAYAFNLNIKDEAKRPFFENVEFRRAISLAIDRERINEAQWLGQGTPSQMTITKLASIYRPEWGEDHPYARHDPDEANRMLDALGLGERNNDGIRLLPNGEPFIVINAFHGQTPLRAYELVKEDFEAVGIGLELRPADGSVIDQGMSGGTIDFVRWNETIGEFQDYLSSGGGHTQSLSHMANQYWIWWQEMNNRRTGASTETGDLPGEEPPPELQEYFQTQIVESKRHPYGSPEQRAASSKAWELQAEWLWNIGVVQAAPMVMVYRSNLGNVPDQVPAFFEGDIGFNLYADQMFFKN